MEYVYSVQWNDVLQDLKDLELYNSEDQHGFQCVVSADCSQVAIENEELMKEASEIRLRLRSVDGVIYAAGGSSTNTDEMIRESYEKVKSELIKPLLENKLARIQHRIDMNRAYINQISPKERKVEQYSTQKMRNNAEIISDKSKSTAYGEHASGLLETKAVSSRGTIKRAATHEEKKEAWRSQVMPYALECLQTMRNIVPSDVFTVTEDELIDNRGMADCIAERILKKRSLWIIQLKSSEILNLTDSEVRGPYCTKGQNLDIVETGAIFAVLPEKYPNEHDPNGVKEEWRHRVEKKFHQMLHERDRGTLPEYRLRHPVYTVLRAAPYEAATHRTGRRNGVALPQPLTRSQSAPPPPRPPPPRINTSSHTSHASRSHVDGFNNGTSEIAKPPQPPPPATPSPYSRQNKHIASVSGREKQKLSAEMKCSTGVGYGTVVKTSPRTKKQYSPKCKKPVRYADV
eukprot:CAMPEP_0185021708 /NCGR_PEP_ID=MMETSP1103-20130426/4408_1 /TAXON_ID=36769 /ORGANISM="Paraphysomonas bandaiensis, Strain Caron Lab Isolate" /LENGTH=459 /DNA_ID=CAMNT_0027553403 /DNA_START=1 /DNA_END=1380 /DNA_ORIENTATION=+